MKDRAALTFVIVTVVVDSMGIGLVMPVMPDLIRDLTGEGIAGAAWWGGLLTFAYSAMQVLFQPLVGALSDAYGRRPVLIASLAAMALDYLIMAAAGSLWLLFVARLASGLAGATYATAYAAIADVTAKAERAARFGLIGMGFGIGFILGPALGGLLGEFGPRAPFLAAGALALGNAVFGWIVFRETLGAGNRRPLELARANPLSALLRVARVPRVGGLVLVLFLFSVAHWVYPLVWSYFAAAQYGWTPGLIGLSLAAVGLGMAVVQGVLIRPILRRLGEAGTATAGLVFNIAMLAVIPFIWKGWVAFAFVPLMALGVIVTPALQAIMANRTGDDRQGELQGAVAAAQAVASLVAPLLLNRIFAVFAAENAVPYLPGAPFLVSSLLCMAALALLVRERAGPARRAA
jgi:DHA1 family tetracycline resistance protein-like MFS transporter